MDIFFVVDCKIVLQGARLVYDRMSLCSMLSTAVHVVVSALCLSWSSG